MDHFHLFRLLVRISSLGSKRKRPQLTRGPSRCADLIGTTAWTTVSSFQGLGLVWWQTVMAVFFGGFLLSLVLAVNGVVGARLHTPFPITARATFGYYFSLFPVVSRCIIGFFWLSINTYQVRLSYPPGIVPFADTSRRRVASASGRCLRH